MKNLEVKKSCRVFSAISQSLPTSVTAPNQQWTNGSRRIGLSPRPAWTHWVTQNRSWLLSAFIFLSDKQVLQQNFFKQNETKKFQVVLRNAFALVVFKIVFTTSQALRAISSLANRGPQLSPVDCLLSSHEVPTNGWGRAATLEVALKFQHASEKQIFQILLLLFILSL